MHNAEYYILPQQIWSWLFWVIYASKADTKSYKMRQWPSYITNQLSCISSLGMQQPDEFRWNPPFVLFAQFIHFDNKYKQ